MMTVIYNEIDHFAAQWLENLIDARQITKGRVLTKSIAELTKEDIADSKQVHLFAGIGGWPLALKLAGWPEDKPVWTGSCPCQPFSVAGKKKGSNDERHLWPEMFRLIKECQPPVIFGEQVASPDGIDWMQAVQADLEAQGYEVGKLDLCAAGIGSPHIRQRIFWVAHRIGQGLEKRKLLEGVLRKMEPDQKRQVSELGWCVERMGNTNSKPQPAINNRQGHSDSGGGAGENCFWGNYEWLLCRDNKIRPTQPGLFPLAHGLPRSLGEGSSREQRLVLSTAKRSRVGQLKGYGNAIVPQLAAIFIRSVMEWMAGTEQDMTVMTNNERNKNDLFR